MTVFLQNHTNTKESTPTNDFFLKILNTFFRFLEIDFSKMFTIFFTKFRMPKILHIIQQSVDEKTLQSIISVGNLPELSIEEIEAIEGHRKGDQSHLLRENYIIHQKGLVVTKVMETFENLSEVILEIMKSCKFDYWISIDLGFLMFKKFMLTNKFFYVKYLFMIFYVNKDFFWKKIYFNEKLNLYKIDTKKIPEKIFMDSL